MRLNDRTYDFLKWLCLIVMPALAVLYATLGKLWNLPYADVIPATINAVATFIGVCIGVSTLTYNKEVVGFEDENPDGSGGDPVEMPEEVEVNYDNEPEEPTDEELKELEEGE